MNPGTALVTGASSGIGAAFARALAARGHPVILVGRDEGRLRAVARELPTAAEVLVADLADREDLQRVEGRLADPARPVEMLVNNAAAGTYGAVVDTDPEVLTRDIDLDVLAVVRLTRAVLPGLLTRGRGGVLNLSSTASTGVAPSMAAYVASKAFVDSWSKNLAEGVRGTGVTVTCVRPGYTRTDFHRRAGEQVDEVPSDWWMEPADVVRAALAAFDAGEVTVVAEASPPARPFARVRRRAVGVLRRRGGS
jgi:short-subunit dehydrogenase